MELSQKLSGYNLQADDWISFLGCWQEALRDLPGDSSGFFLRYSGVEKSNESVDSLFIHNKNLPPSFVDFYGAYIQMGGEFRETSINDGIGILSPKEIKPLSIYMKQLWDVKNEWPTESIDINYFKYGIDQDDAAIRTSYQKNAIVIGQYGFSEYELIVLYPDSLTKDGEMETALFAHASEARTPSFAEMMRQLSYYFINDPDSIPIYSQEQIRGTCADRLPLDGVWWK